jgi:tRNA pseudouridine38-40 synthase
MRRIRITVSYDGTDYHGWQVQPNVATIQRTIESVVTEIEGARVHVHASGRTDAGVHALAQVAAFDLANPIPCENLVRAMNRLLPRDIRILHAEEAAPDFHPRYQAVAKTYEYRILRAEICPPFERLYVYHHPYPLGEPRMIELARALEGEHDFSAFAAADETDHQGRSKVRRIFSSQFNRDSAHLIYRVRGSGFLKHMVRNIVGVLLEAGKGNLTASDLQTRLTPACKIPPGPTAPARGLFLISVEYQAQPTDISLRKASTDDFAFAQRLYFETMGWIIERLFGWDQAREERNFLNYFKFEEARIIAANGRDVGWLQERVDSATIHLLSLYVMPEMQRRGIGTQVLQTVLAKAGSESKPVTLSVVKINPAVRLYERHGFQVTHEDEYKFYMRADPPKG